MKIGSLIRQAHSYGMGPVGLIVGKTTAMDGTHMWIVKWTGKNRREHINPRFLELVP